jgi:hypothetical protein
MHEQGLVDQQSSHDADQQPNDCLFMNGM